MHVSRFPGLTNLPRSEVAEKIRRNWTNGTRMTSDFDRMEKKGEKAYFYQFFNHSDEKS